MPITTLPRPRRLLLWLSVVALSILAMLAFWSKQQQVAHSMLDIEMPLCRHFPGTDDVLVVFKTGANEVDDKLSVHLPATLTCYPNHVIFSDYEEELSTGEQLLDAFIYTSSSIKQTHQDFALWRKLQAEGRAGIQPSELSGTGSREKPEDVRKKIPGWQLDKWKFLPMVNQTLHMYPTKHWYVFVEADTYLFWSNLLIYLAARPWTDDHYIGSPVYIEGLSFAHGGSGFLLSRPALKKVVGLFNQDQARWEAFTDQNWIDDHILAAALREAGVLLHDDSPTWQGKPAGLLDFHPDEGVWCSMAMTFHHQLPAEIEDLWRFEQTAISARLQPNNKTQLEVLRHRDVLERYLLPLFQHSRTSWDNQGVQERHPATSIQQCEALCAADAECRQYALRNNSTCKISSQVVLGMLRKGSSLGGCPNGFGRCLIARVNALNSVFALVED